MVHGIPMAGAGPRHLVARQEAQEFRQELGSLLCDDSPLHELTRVPQGTTSSISGQCLL